MIETDVVDGDIADVVTGLVINLVDGMDEPNGRVYHKWDIDEATPLSGDTMIGLAHIIAISNSLYIANCYLTFNHKFIDVVRMTHAIESSIAFAAHCEFDVHIPFDVWTKVGHIFLALNTQYEVSINLYNTQKEN
jgi:hypothetical protein